MKERLNHIHVLIVEDNEDDAELMKLQMESADWEVKTTRVETKSEMMAALSNKKVDVVLSDYTLPRFSGPDAFACLKEANVDAPFIVVSGTIGEDRAISMMRSGVSDFVFKNQLSRLVPVISRELKEVLNEKEKREAQDRYRQIVETAHEGVSLWSPSGRILFANGRMRELFGGDESESSELDILRFIDPQKEKQHFVDLLQKGLPGQGKDL